MKGRSGAWGGGDDVGLDFRERKGMAMGCEEKRATTLVSEAVGVLLDSSCFECPWEMLRLGFNGLVVMISVLHTEGLRFDPGLNHFLLVSEQKIKQHDFYFTVHFMLKQK
jgi:hypothetical protein